MTRFLVLLLFFVALAFQLRAQSPTEVYAPKDGNFTVRLSGKPKESTQPTKTPLGELNVFTATYANSDGNTFMISYTDFPADAVKPDSRETLYDGVRDELRGKDGKLVAEKAKDVGMKKVPGRDIDIERDKGKQRLRFRVVLHEGRLYQVAVIGTAKFVEGKDATAFLDSFDITK